MPSRRPWFRLYTAWRTDARVQGLPPPVRAAAINLLCLAAENGDQGRIELAPGKPYPPATLALALNIHPKSLHKVLSSLVENGVFGLSIGVDGTMNLSKWPDSQPADPTGQERMARLRQIQDNRNTTVTPPSQDRNNLVTVTAQSRVQKKSTVRIEEEDKTSASPPQPPTAGASLDLQGWFDRLASSDNHVGILGEMITTLRGGEVSLSRLASVLGRVYYRDAGNMARVIWENKDRQIAGDFLSYVEMAKGGQESSTTRGFEEDAARYGKWTQPRKTEDEGDYADMSEKAVKWRQEHLDIPPSPLSGKGGDGDTK